MPPTSRSSFLTVSPLATSTLLPTLPAPFYDARKGRWTRVKLDNCLWRNPFSLVVDYQSVMPPRGQPDCVKQCA